MNRNSNAQKNLSIDSASQVTTDGLEHIFSHRSSAAKESVTVSDAAETLGLNSDEVVSLIRQGKLCATKDAKSKHWLICLESIQEYADEHPQVETQTELNEEFVELCWGHEIVDSPAVVHSSADLHSVLDQLHAANQKLQAANYRIGYLEAQVEFHREKSALLQNEQVNISFWDRLIAKFSGR